MDWGDFVSGVNPKGGPVSIKRLESKRLLLDAINQQDDRLKKGMDLRQLWWW